MEITKVIVNVLGTWVVLSVHAWFNEVELPEFCDSPYLYNACLEKLNVGGYEPLLDYVVEDMVKFGFV